MDTPENPLSNPFNRNQLILQIQKDIDAFCRTEFADDPRKHLGASIIGHECGAYPWNVFRWLKREDFDGDMLRLFNRGHLEEPRFFKWLRGIGFDVREFADNGEQFRVSGVDGHFGGSLDAIAMPPPAYGIFEPILVECKTHNQKSFDKLEKEGVQIAKPEHYTQMCSYGRAYDFKYALYCAVNKNTDELYFEFVVLDYAYADNVYRKADSIIHSQEQPVKIAATPTFWKCKHCTFVDICHNKAKPEKNCRSCKFAHPMKNGQWQCINPKYFDVSEHLNLPDKRIAIGCDAWTPIINAG